MKGRFLLVVVCFQCLLLVFFSKLSDDSENLTKSENSQIPTLNSPKKQIAEEEIVRANQIIDFYNASLVLLEQKIVPEPMQLTRQAEQYLHSWQLPEVEEFPDPNQLWDYLEPDKALFGQALAVRLNALSQQMRSAYGEIFSLYEALQKYVADKRILDDGKRGEQLVSSIIASHGRFSNARQEWCQLVEIEAEDAQQLLFSHHPFKQNVFFLKELLRLFSETSTLLGQEKIDRAQIVSKATHMRELMGKNDSAIPAVSPAKALYLSFIDHGTTFINALEQGIRTGFFDSIKHKMNKAHLECIRIYNDFVQHINRTPAQSIFVNRQ